LQLKRQHNYSLVIAGDGPVNVVNQLKRLAEQVSNIHFTGFILGEMSISFM